MYKIPILILVYNRPDTFKKLIYCLKKIQPKKIYIRGDGPVNADDVIKINAVKKTILRINWNCKILTNFNKINIGCRGSVSSGIDWFFSTEKMGVILEDDCLPNTSFFKFCEILLKRFRYNKKIYTISGSNFQNKITTDNDYYFTKYPHCWGWATWARAWKSYDQNLSFWTKWKKTDKWKKYIKLTIEKKYWEKIFNNVLKKKIDSWAYVWTASVWYKNGVAIVPKTSLINNIGFDDRATHTQNSQTKSISNLKNLKFPLKHPKRIKIDIRADNYTFFNHFKGVNYLWPWRFIHLVYLFFLNPRIFIVRFYKKLSR